MPRLPFQDDVMPTCETSPSIPDDLRAFQDDVYGVGGIVRAVSDLAGGWVKEARFVRASVDDHGNWRRVGAFAIGRGAVNGVPCFLWIGGGSSSIVPSYRGPCQCQDQARVVGMIVAAQGAQVFRAKMA